jgi:hypothetical protein
VKYAFCNHEIQLFDKVLHVYDAGDCDTGIVHGIFPDDGFGTLQIYFPETGVTLLRTIVENQVHFDCDEDE